MADKPVEGVQLYVFAPDAVSVTDDPVVIDAEEGDTEMTGRGFTNISTGCVIAIEDPMVAFRLKCVVEVNAKGCA